MDFAPPAMDFHLNSSSYGGACYTSAPSSPEQLTELYCGFDELLIAAGRATQRNSLATVPFAWEEKPGVPKTPNSLSDDDFSFDVSCHFDNDSFPADDLFHGGVIKTAVVPPPIYVQERNIEKSERGRERGFSSSRLPSSRSRRTRSLSPLGSSELWRDQMETVAPPSPASSSGESRKWSFIDLLLFRSASDGRAMEKDPLRKYSANFRKHDQDIRNSGSVSKRKGRVSAHELHYNVNRAVSNDMKKKTYLPYKQGILGRFSFNPQQDF